MKVRYTVPAAADLERILAYLEERSAQGARSVRARIRAIERLLAEFPAAGRPVTRAEVRRIVFYTCDTTTVTISRSVMHLAARFDARADPWTARARAATPPT